MRAYGRYTKQIGVNTKNEKVIKYDYILDEDDLVLVATDGLFDNMSIDTIIASVKSKNPASSNILAILNHLHTLAQNNENSF
jgi:serine/threonine protein phosphatase PrpC